MAFLFAKRVFAKSRLRFGLQVQSKTETKPNFGLKRVCEEQHLWQKGAFVRDSDYPLNPRKTVAWCDGNCKYKISSWHLNGSSDGISSNIGSTV